MPVSWFVRHVRVFAGMWLLAGGTSRASAMALQRRSSATLAAPLAGFCARPHPATCYAARPCGTCIVSRARLLPEGTTSSGAGRRAAWLLRACCREAALPNASPQALDALVRSRAVDVLATRSAVIDAEPVGAGVDSEAVEIFEF